jgi:hypothetical protein
MADEQTTTRGVLAASLCNAFNGGVAWDFLKYDSRVTWLHHADRVFHELAQHEHMVIAIDEVGEDHVG